MSKPLPILHITDTLETGGLERVVVNLVNHLPQERCRAMLCTTRRNGPLADQVAPHVIRLQLRRRHRFDVQAVKRLASFIREHDIQVLHSHGPSLFIAVLASFFSPFPTVIWHVHSGRLANGGGKIWPYRLVAGRINGVIAVNQALAEWVCQKLNLASDKVWYVPNFICRNTEQKKKLNLPGDDGGRIVCLANLRPLKDHPALLQAMAIVIKKFSHAHLLLIGSTSDNTYLAKIQKLVSNYQLEKHVSFLGHREDVMDILAACDIGVLNSISEGFPMTLLEYGMAGLPTVATNVGQCSEVLDKGRAGILVPPGSPAKLAEALLELLQSLERRVFLGKQLNSHVQEKYDQHRILEKICHCYESVLSDKKDNLSAPERHS